MPAGYGKVLRSLLGARATVLAVLARLIRALARHDGSAGAGGTVDGFAHQLAAIQFPG